MTLNANNNKVSCISHNDCYEPIICKPEPCPPPICPPEPCKPIIAANEYGYITGDPHLRGGDGELFNLNPIVGKTYNALTDKNLAYNITIGQITKWGQTTGVASSSITVTGNCGKKSEITFNKCGVATLKTTDPCGNTTITTIERCQVYNLADGGTVRYGQAYGGGSDGLSMEERLIIKTAEGYEITQVARDGGYIDSNIQTGSNGVFTDGVMPTGLIGDTFDADRTPRVAIDNQGTGVLNNPLCYYQVGESVVISDLKPHYDNYNSCSCQGTDDNDVFYSKKNKHSMNGGLGDDLYYVCHKKNDIFENGYEGNDSVISSINYNLDDHVENLRFSGKGNYKGCGNDLDNLMIGNKGKNILDGGCGADTLIGGIGNDIYYVEDNSDKVLENACQGNDTVIAAISYSLTANVENLILVSNASNATGNNLNNEITGNSSDNIIIGGKGNDELKGCEGNDTYKFSAGDGIDVVCDKYGNDKVVFDSSVSDESVSFKFKGKDLIISYGNNECQDKIVVKNAKCDSSFEVQLSSGNCIDINEINSIINNMSCYGKSDYSCISSTNNTNNNECMNIYSYCWNQ